jgi:8-oxo-dGTP pyrophosphatase MutT (NUDIX family)
MLILDELGERILLAGRRERPEDLGLIGGKLDPGETPRDAAIREAHEEARVRVLECEEVFVADGVVTYLATRWERDAGEGNCPVRWGTWQDAIAGSFGDYNQRLRIIMWGRATHAAE